ncbi:hypothetical protein [Crocosphaera sp. XPORK-15E]|uniref:hypothetical protein n=1 Tax=Crocosphaera sp. XPORK-15E TaxID=3110247 RepID=UPI002B1EF346|nr:hypothetical protein [Crocosphaera sp. XPORK-15E]MEA5536423.1 hypothetical protein [Crocosphaera sp. XPORK-15E]
MHVISKFELLVLLIEAYEQQYYPMNKTNPIATLESLIYEFDINYESLIYIFGDIKTLEAIMTDKQEISSSQAESLAEFFNHLSPKLALTSHNFTQIKV